jgi:hypothetical protein
VIVTFPLLAATSANGQHVCFSGCQDRVGLDSLALTSLLVILLVTLCNDSYIADPHHYRNAMVGFSSASQACRWPTGTASR